MIPRLFRSAVAFLCFCLSAHAGIIEICKVSDPSGSLADPFYFFTIAGESQLGSILVPVDACSDTIQLPADGQYTITETPDPTSELEDVYTFPDFALLSVDLPDDSATVLSEGGTDPTQEVTVFFVNTPAAAVPEPATGWPLLSLGLTVMALRGKLRKHP